MSKKPLQSTKPSLLLSACCGPCATIAFERLSPTYNITTHFWGNNFDNKEEYEKRLKALRAVNTALNNNNPIIAEPYSPDTFLAAIKGLESAPEGGERCLFCYNLRLRSAAAIASRQGFTAFATTLTASPHKNTCAINAQGNLTAKESGVTYVALNLKEANGFKESVALSKELGIYRQNYCGCKFSK